MGQTAQQLDDYSPLKTLNRGYTYVTDRADKTISSISQTKAKDEVNIHFKDGQAKAIISSTRRNKNDNEEK